MSATIDESAGELKPGDSLTIAGIFEPIPWWMRLGDWLSGRKRERKLQRFDIRGVTDFNPLRRRYPQLPLAHRLVPMSPIEIAREHGLTINEGAIITQEIVEDAGKWSRDGGKTWERSAHCVTRCEDWQTWPHSPGVRINRGWTHISAPFPSDLFWVPPK